MTLSDGSPQGPLLLLQGVKTSETVSSAALGGLSRSTGWGSEEEGGGPSPVAPWLSNAIANIKYASVGAAAPQPHAVRKATQGQKLALFIEVGR